MRYVVVSVVIFSGLATGQELPKNADEVKSRTTLTSYDVAKALAASDNLSELNGVKTLSAVTASAFEGYQHRL